MITRIESMKAARERIVNGWCKNALSKVRKDGGINYCALGACVSSGFNVNTGPLWDSIPPGPWGRSIAAFNNHPDTTHQDVIALFDRAIAKIASQEGSAREQVGEWDLCPWQPNKATT